jgi:hypothetical protein
MRGFVTLRGSAVVVMPRAMSWGLKLTHDLSDFRRIPRTLRFSFAPLAVCFLVAYFLFLITAVAARATEAPLVYSILRNGVELGLHEVQFQRDGNNLTVTMHGQAVYRIGTLVFYKFETRRSEIWTENKLVSFQVWTDDDGKISDVVGVREGDEFRVTGPKGVSMVSGDAVPESFWNVDAVKAHSIIDNKTGRPIPVTVSAGSVETIEACGEEIKATRYRVDKVPKDPHDLWYDENGRWVRMETTARDMSKVEFVLRQ